MYLWLDYSTVTATLETNTIRKNRATARGGGLYLYDSAGAIISGNLVYSNTASGAGGWDGGGGLYMDTSPATLDGNTICSNTVSGYGGGLYLNSSAATLNGNVVCANTAPFHGGGLYVEYSNAKLNNNTVTANAAGWSGGGLCLWGSDDTLRDNLITTNTATYYGGGSYLYYSDATMINNVIADNRADQWGDGLGIQASAPHLWHTTIARNHGGDGSGIYITDSGVNSTVRMTNTIVAYHTTGVTVTTGNAATLNGTLWHANTTPWSSNVTRYNDHAGNPAFAADGYHLTIGSQAIDQGVVSGVTQDIDGDSRPQDGVYDIGADEFTCVPVTDVLINGPLEGIVNTAYAFTAAVTPSSATEPIVYTWAPVPGNGQSTPNSSYVWTAEGSKNISVTVSNCGGAAITDTHPIEIRKHYIYLPLVLR
jgi:parallel beta-helix repeat protein